MPTATWSRSSAVSPPTASTSNHAQGTAGSVSEAGGAPKGAACFACDPLLSSVLLTGSRLALPRALQQLVDLVPLLGQVGAVLGVELSARSVALLHQLHQPVAALLQ